MLATRRARTPAELDISLERRFWQRFRVNTDNECWEWTGRLNKTGYGVIKRGRRLLLAHRVGYEIQIGPIPEGLPLDHLCRNTRCVRGDHLEPVSHRVNALRGFGPTAQNARKTHCKRGHAFDEINTRVRNGQRWCRKCDVIRSKLSRTRRKARPV